MFTIRQWLEALGLERYINAFEENEITVGLVPDLADAEIKRAGNGRHGPSQDILSGCRET